jgi:hypothetical protein
MSVSSENDEDAIRPPSDGIAIFRHSVAAVDPFDELEERGDYAGALRLHDKLYPDWEDGDEDDLHWRAKLLIPLKRYDEALHLLRRADEMGASSRISPGLRKLEDIAFVQWLLGECGGALASMREYINGFGTRKVGYSRSLNGLHEALLLRYYAISLSSVDDIRRADAFMEKRLSKPNDMWPAPLCATILGQIPMEDALFDATGSRSLEQAIRLAKKGGGVEEHFLALRRLADLLFHLGAEQRRTARSQTATNYFRLCAELPKCKIEHSWRLAIWETENPFGMAHIPKIT